MCKSCLFTGLTVCQGDRHSIKAWLCKCRDRAGGDKAEWDECWNVRGGVLLVILDG